MIISVILLTILIAICECFVPLGVGMSVVTNSDVGLRKKGLDLRAMIAKMLYDQEMSSCCKRMHQSPTFYDRIDCSQISDGMVVVPDGGYGNPNFYEYFWRCISKGKDHTECCVDHGISRECLPICNSAKRPSFEDMNIMLAKPCFTGLTEVLSACIAKSRAKLVGAKVLVQLKSPQEIN